MLFFIRFGGYGAGASLACARQWPGRSQLLAVPQRRIANSARHPRSVTARPSAAPSK
jgi:hypothetical protein